MFYNKLIKIISKKVKINIYIYLIVLFLIFISFLTIINLIGTFQLRRQTNIILKQFANYENNIDHAQIIPAPESQPLIVVDAEGKVIISIPEKDKEITSTSVKEDNTQDIITEFSPLLDLDTPPITENVVFPSKTINQLSVNANVYSNIAVDNFSNSYFIDNDKTDLYFDEKTTALMFRPLYDFSYEKTCLESFCGLDKRVKSTCIDNLCLTTDGAKVYYQGAEQVLPAGISGKNIINIDIETLSTKWLVAFLIQSEGQEEIHVYFFEDNKFISLINPSGPLKLTTNYGRSNGYLSAAGSDEQFLLLYSGYESLAFLYNKGVWQDVSVNLGLRVMAGGFPSRIIKDGAGRQAAWYICSLDSSKPKLIKLWQNNTDQIQGSVDLSKILGGAAICAYRSPGILEIASSNGLYVFRDKGFDNSHHYSYQSINLSSFKDKKVISASLRSIILNADKQLFGIALSSNGGKWETPDSASSVNFTDAGDKLYARVNFKPGASTYSPWFYSLGTISYRATD